MTALREYGRGLGMAFQIRDDVLDLIGDEGELGKPVTSDLMQGKMSLATIRALQQSREVGNVQASGDLSSEMNLLRRTGALEYATQKAKEYAVEAQRSLVALPESVVRRELFGLADFAVARIS